VLTIRDFVNTLRRLNMSKDVNKPIKITEIEEHEDGSATLQLDLDSKTFAAIFNVGFVHLVMKGMESDDRQSTSSMSL
tara:strand:- start:434 stop:667 length:234 start_codon:yes stop_codon:yes gene_type:complete